MSNALTAVNNILPTMLGGAVIILFGLWRNAVWRERSAKFWVGYFERDRDRMQKLLYWAIGIGDDDHRISIAHEPGCRSGALVTSGGHRTQCSCGWWSDCYAQLSDTQRAVEVHLRRPRREDGR
jgi:hypothetical protein